MAHIAWIAIVIMAGIGAILTFIAFCVAVIYALIELFRGY